MNERSAEDVWAEIQDKCQEAQNAGDVIPTISAQTPVEILEVAPRKIKCKSPRSRSGEGSISKSAVTKIWKQLVATGEATYRNRTAALALVNLLDGIEPKPDGTTAIVIADRALAMRGYLDRPTPTEVPQPDASVRGSYGIDEVIAEGCFHSRDRLESILRRLKDKRNLVLQGSPGTGKSWLARRLAKCLVGLDDPEFIRSVQFHPGTSYEDFVRGWRPEAGGQLVITDGPLLKLARHAAGSPERAHVLIIEEINRGNPAQAFGELLTLIEGTKRSPDDALMLTYPDPSGQYEPFFLPPNIFIVGTMNVADRSLALVDFALRRRFAFEHLEPAFTAAWELYVRDLIPGNDRIIDHIRKKIGALNQVIAEDPMLGDKYAIGHSFFTPARLESNGWQWYDDIVKTELSPLLQEYWFDDPEKAVREIEALRGT